MVRAIERLWTMVIETFPVYNWTIISQYTVGLTSGGWAGVRVQLAV